MKKAHSPYPPEFRRQIVELVRAGRTPGELAREFEPSAQTIRNWVAQAERDAGERHDGVTSTKREELSRLRRENKQLKTEREILKNDRMAPRPSCGNRNSDTAILGLAEGSGRLLFGGLPR